MMNDDSYSDSQIIECRQNDRGNIDLEEKINEMWGIIDDLKHKVAEERELLKREKFENEALMEEHAQIRQSSSLLHLPACPVRSLDPCPVHPFKSHHTLPSKNNLGLSADSPERFSLEEDLFHGDNNKYHFRELLERLRNQEKKEMEEEEDEDLFPEVSRGPSSYVTRHCDTEELIPMMVSSWKNRPQTQPTVSGTLDVEERKGQKESTLNSGEPLIFNQF